MKETIDHWIAIWARLTPANRALLLVLPVMLALGVTVTVNPWSGEPYIALYTGLTPAATGEVVARLSALGVPCRVSEGGSVVLVPRTHVKGVRASTIPESYRRDLAPGDGGSFDSAALGQRAAVRSFIDSGTPGMIARALGTVTLLFGLICLHKSLVHLSVAVAAAGHFPQPNATTCPSPHEREDGAAGLSSVRPSNGFVELARTSPAQAAEVIETLMSESPCR